MDIDDINKLFEDIPDPNPHFNVDPKRLQELRERLRQNSTAKPSLISPMKLSWTAKTFFFAGKKGDRWCDPNSRNFWPFIAKEIYFDDSQKGRGTLVSLHVGPTLVFNSVPSWVFRDWMPPEEEAVLEAASKLLGSKFETKKIRDAVSEYLRAKTERKTTIPVCKTGENFEITVQFLADCSFWGVVWGEELK